MRKLIRRLASPSCSRCRDRVSPYVVACAHCGSDMGRSPLLVRRDGALVWLLGGAVVGCVTMLALSAH